MFDRGVNINMIIFVVGEKIRLYSLYICLKTDVCMFEILGGI